MSLQPQAGSKNNKAGGVALVGTTVKCAAAH